MALYQSIPFVLKLFSLLTECILSLQEIILLALHPQLNHVLDHIVVAANIIPLEQHLDKFDGSLDSRLRSETLSY